MSGDALGRQQVHDSEAAVAIEKAFAIDATPDEIFAALERDLMDAAEHVGDTFEVLRREPGRSLELRVTIGGVPCWLTYRLEPKEGHTEVVAVLVPFGIKYTLFRIITLGLRDQGFALALVQGLANLKEEVEGAHGEHGRPHGECAGGADGA
jgi:hypothetical protein